MNIEIRKAGFVNKGAEMMLAAASARLKTTVPEAVIAVPPSFPPAKDVPINEALRRGFFLKPERFIYGFDVGHLLTRALPKTLRRSYRIFSDSDVDVIFDAAGFAYGDQWNPRQTIDLGTLSKRWRRAGKKLILLPQAFGPFTSRTIRSGMAEIIENASLIYARDEESAAFIRDVGGNAPNLRVSPDFTIEMIPRPNTESDFTTKDVAIVPNRQISQRASSDTDRENYIQAMASVAELVRKQGKQPFLLVHEGAGDIALAKAINGHMAEAMTIYQESNLMALLKRIGECYAMIGSRYHALVAALAQGVPALAFGWSHKYEALFRDFGLDDCLLDHGDMKATFRRVEELLDPTRHSQTRSLLLESGEQVRSQTEAMWIEIAENINVAGH